VMEQLENCLKIIKSSNKFSGTFSRNIKTCKIFKKTKSQNIYSGGKKPKLILVLKSPEISFSLFDFFSHNFQF